MPGVLDNGSRIVHSFCCKQTKVRRLAIVRHSGTSACTIFKAPYKQQLLTVTTTTSPAQAEVHSCQVEWTVPLQRNARQLKGTVHHHWTQGP
jgi:hypothetical protein